MAIMSVTDADQKPDEVLNAEQRETVFIRKQDMGRLDVFDKLAEDIAAKAATRGMTNETLTQVIKDVS